MTVSSAIIILLSSIIGAFGYITSAYISNYREVNSMQRQKSHLEKVVQLYEIMNDCIADTVADRIMIFTTHNGDGMPGLFKPFKISALYGSNLYKDTKHLYQNVPVDESYTKMLLTIQEKKSYYFNTEVSDQCLLKMIYENEDVKHSQIHWLIDSGIGMMYVSFASHSKDDFDVTDLIQFEFAVEKMKIILADEKRKIKFLSWLRRFILNTKS